MTLHPDYEAAIAIAGRPARTTLLDSAMRLSTITRIRECCRVHNLDVVIWNRDDNPDHWKHPRIKEWNTKKFSADAYRPGQQIGAKLATEIAPGKCVAAVDFDWADGIPFASAFIANTGLATRRASKSLSHAFYTLNERVPTAKYDDIDGTTLVELRCAKTSGDVGFLSLLPPSLHPSGEILQWIDDGTGISHCPELPCQVRNYAITCMLVRHLQTHGFGHDERLATAGFLLRLGLFEKDVIDIASAVLAKTGNKDLHDVPTTVRTTVAKLRAGNERVAGKSALAKAIGDDGKKVVARISDWIRGIGGGDSDVVMRGGALHAIVNRAEAALLAGPTPIYQRGGCLIRPIRLDRAVGDGDTVRREAGSMMLLAVREPWLLEQMARVQRWLRVKADGELVPADPGAIYSRTLLGRGEWRFPVLRGVVTAPTLARDGGIIESPGFDAASGLLLDFPASSFPPVPSAPIRDEALRALARLAHPLRGFPFADEASKSVALSAMLTALVRLSLRTSPLHAFDAPTAGTGKSLLAELVGLTATGSRPPALSQGKTAEEDEKRLSTVLFAGDPVIHIDNCERAVSGDFLCSMLTQEVVQARILGLSERRVLPCTSLVLASGNNLTLAGDTSRRAVLCRLDARVERPDTRQFDFDCHAEVLAARPELVVDGLTILRAYALAGRPEKLTPMGSFADWEWIRGALVWLGCADPADTRDSVLDADPRKDELRTVMDAWEKSLGDERIEVGDIPNWPSLRDVLSDVACRGVWSSKSVGWWLRRHKDRVLDGRCFRCESERNHQRWWLVVRSDSHLFPDGTRGARPGWLATYLAPETE